MIPPTPEDMVELIDMPIWKLRILVGDPSGARTRTWTRSQLIVEAIGQDVCGLAFVDISEQVDLELTENERRLMEHEEAIELVRNVQELSRAFKLEYHQLALSVMGALKSLSGESWTSRAENLLVEMLNITRSEYGDHDSNCGEAGDTRG